MRIRNVYMYPRKCVMLICRNKQKALEKILEYAYIRSKNITRPNGEPKSPKETANPWIYWMDDKYNEIPYLKHLKDELFPHSVAYRDRTEDILENAFEENVFSVVFVNPEAAIPLISKDHSVRVLQDEYETIHGVFAARCVLDNSIYLKRNADATYLVVFPNGKSIESLGPFCEPEESEESLDSQRHSKYARHWLDFTLKQLQTAGPCIRIVSHDPVIGKASLDITHPLHFPPDPLYNGDVNTAVKFILCDSGGIPLSDPSPIIQKINKSFGCNIIIESHTHGQTVERCCVIHLTSHVLKKLILGNAEDYINQSKILAELVTTLLS